MTDVEFQFNFPGGEPIANTEFVVKLAKSGFVQELDGILMPTDTVFTTDSTGRATVSLAPSDSPYTVRMTNPDHADDVESCVRGINYRFYVPVSDVPVRAQDLVLNPPPTNLPYDQAAILAINDAKLASVNAASIAVESAEATEAAVELVTEAAAEVNTNTQQVTVLTAEAKNAAVAAETSSTQAAASASIVGGFSVNLLLTWANVQNFRLVSASRDSNGAIITAEIIWPDGILGVFTTLTPSVEFPGAIDSWQATYLGTIPKVLTQPAVTRDDNGAVVGQPAITIV